MRRGTPVGVWYAREARWRKCNAPATDPHASGSGHAALRFLAQHYLRFLAQHQVLDAEVGARVGPHPLDGEAGLRGQPREALEVVLVGVLDQQPLPDVQ